MLFYKIIKDYQQKRKLSFSKKIFFLNLPFFLRAKKSLFFFAICLLKDFLIKQFLNPLLPFSSIYISQNHYSHGGYERVFTTKIFRDSSF